MNFQFWWCQVQDSLITEPVFYFISFRLENGKIIALWLGGTLELNTFTNITAASHHGSISSDCSPIPPQYIALLVVQHRVITTGPSPWQDHLVTTLQLERGLLVLVTRYQQYGLTLI